MRPSKLDILHPTLQLLYELWDGARGKRPLPLRHDLPPRLLKPWSKHLVIIGGVETGEYFYQYYGASFIEAFKADLTGRRLTVLEQDKATIIRLDYDTAAKTLQPIARVYTAEFAGEAQTWHRLVLPVADRDPQTVSLLLVGAYQIRK